MLLVLQVTHIGIGVALARGVSKPREIVPGRFYMITRRCAQQQFLLRPDRATNDAFIYCLALAAERCKIEVICSVAESNHHHTVIYDRYGRVSEFIENFHRLVARSQNALRGHWENFWANGEPCVTCLVDPETVIDKIVYAATNPVKDHLVERVRHWPGVNTYANLVNERPLVVRRPLHFFRPDGPTPPMARLELQIPAELGEREQVIAEIRARVAELERSLRKERQRTGKRIVGRHRILEQDWRDSPRSREPRRQLRPRFAGREEHRIKALIRYRDFLTDYCAARQLWLAGFACRFPVGTYWLARFAPVRVNSFSN